MASKLHQGLLKNIPDIQLRKRFRTSVVRALRNAFHVCEDEFCKEDPEFCKDQYKDLFDHDYYAPDGFTLKIDREQDSVELVLYEADTSNPPSAHLLEKYSDLWWAFDSQSEDWVVRLVVVDRFGVHHEVDLCSYWYAFREDDRCDLRNHSQIAIASTTARAYFYRHDRERALKYVQAPETEPYRVFV